MRRARCLELERRHNVVHRAGRECTSSVFAQCQLFCRAAVAVVHPSNAAYRLVAARKACTQRLIRIQHQLVVDRVQAHSTCRDRDLLDVRFRGCRYRPCDRLARTRLCRVHAHTGCTLRSSHCAVQVHRQGRCRVQHITIARECHCSRVARRIHNARRDRLARTRHQRHRIVACRPRRARTRCDHPCHATIRTHLQCLICCQRQTVGQRQTHLDQTVTGQAVARCSRIVRNHHRVCAAWRCRHARVYGHAQGIAARAGVARRVHDLNFERMCATAQGTAQGDVLGRAAPVATAQIACQNGVAAHHRVAVAAVNDLDHIPSRKGLARQTAHRDHRIGDVGKVIAIGTAAPKAVAARRQVQRDGRDISYRGVNSDLSIGSSTYFA